MRPTGMPQRRADSGILRGGTHRQPGLGEAEEQEQQCEHHQRHPDHAQFPAS